MNEPRSFGSWLRRRRKALGLTQAALADQVACSGDTVRKLEADARRPSAEVAQRIMRVLEVDAAEQPALLRLARHAPLDHDAEGRPRTPRSRRCLAATPSWPRCSTASSATIPAC